VEEGRGTTINAAAAEGEAAAVVELPAQVMATKAVGEQHAHSSSAFRIWDMLAQVWKFDYHSRGTVRGLGWVV
jgi:hypothetical protein